MNEIIIKAQIHESICNKVRMNVVKGLLEVNFDGHVPNLFLRTPHGVTNLLGRMTLSLPCLLGLKLV